MYNHHPVQLGQYTTDTFGGVKTNAESKPKANDTRKNSILLFAEQKFIFISGTVIQRETKVSKYKQIYK